MDNLTPQQRQMLQSWTEKRDGLLADIRIYSMELEELQKSTVSKGEALAALHVSIGEARGRLAEIDALETRMRGSLATDISELEVRKSRLQGECTALDEKLKGGEEKLYVITNAVTQLESVHETMKDQSAIVNRVVGEIIQTSTLHTSEMKTIMSEIKSISDSVVERGNENIAQTKIILEKLPKYIFELQKPIPVRRMYSPERGTHIPPDKTP